MKKITNNITEESKEFSYLEKGYYLGSNDMLYKKIQNCKEFVARMKKLLYKE